MAIKIGILGATGYTGNELVASLLRHPEAKIVWLGSESQPGQDYGRLFPRFLGRLPVDSARLVNLSDSRARPVDLVFSCLPHGASATHVMPFLEGGARVVDLSADFRLQDRSRYESTYATEHGAPEWIPKSCYGLCEVHAEAVVGARLVGNPGCYPTSALLPLIPLLRAGIISTDGIIIDSKSGVSGAGRKATDATHYVNCNESFSAYKIGDQHRHISEIEEQLALAAGIAPASSSAPRILFTPHLVPMERGILSTIYCDLRDGQDGAKAQSVLIQHYSGADFVHVVEELPRTADVSHTNRCHIKVYQPKGTRKLMLVSVIDNLVKGASGQAIQNMNLMFGLPQSYGLS